MRRILALLATLTLVFLAPPAWAGGGQGTDIDWFYNSGDHDAQARFVSVGEHIGLCKLNNAKVYAEFGVLDGGTEPLYKTYYDGAQDSCTDYDWDVIDGKTIRLRVCEVKTGLPNDCSGWRYGTA